VRCGAGNRQALEQLCRYITHPALANERVQLNAAGQVMLKLKTPGRDGTTNLVTSPPEFMHCQVVLTPRPAALRRKTQGIECQEGVGPCRPHNRTRRPEPVIRIDEPVS